MPFELFKQKVIAYLTEFYSRYGKLFVDRPESSYQTIFDNEAAGVNRYIQGVVDEIAYEVRELFEEKFDDKKADQLYEQFRSFIPKTELNGYKYQAARSSGSTTSAAAGYRDESYTQSYQPVRVSGGNSRSKQQLENRKFLVVSMSGAALGTIAGYMLGKTFLYALGGFTAGGLAGSAAAVILMSRLPKSGRRYVTLSSTNAHGTAPSQSSKMSESYSAVSVSPSPRQSVQLQLDKRHKEVSQFILLLIDQMKHNYGTLIQSAS